MVRDRSSELLQAGAFLGRRHRAISVGDFLLSQWTANCPPFGDRHAHEEAHFVFVLSGDYVSSAQACGAQLTTPLVYTPPAVYHDDHLVDGAGGFVSISLGAELTRPEGAKRISDKPMQMGGLRPQMVARRVTQALSAGPSWDAAELEALCLELTCCVWDLGAERSPTPWLRTAREALSDPFAKTPSLKTLSRSLGVHPVYFTRSFRQVYGCTPGEYARAVRLGAAAQMITFDSSSLAEVAAACGFADQSHLTTQFNRAFGLSPARYRACTSPRAAGKFVSFKTGRAVPQH